MNAVLMKANRNGCLYLPLFLRSLYHLGKKGAALNCGSMYIVPRETEKCH